MLAGKADMECNKVVVIVYRKIYVEYGFEDQGFQDQDERRLQRWSKTSRSRCCRITKGTLT